MGLSLQHLEWYEALLAMDGTWKTMCIPFMNQVSLYWFGWVYPHIQLAHNFLSHDAVMVVYAHIHHSSQAPQNLRFVCCKLLNIKQFVEEYVWAHNCHLEMYSSSLLLLWQGLVSPEVCCLLSGDFTLQIREIRKILGR